MIEGLIAGAIAGAAYGIISYAKTQDENTFDFNYLLPTIVGTAAIGAYAQYSGLAIDVLATSAIGLAVTQTARKLWNIALTYLDSKVKG